MTPLAPPLTFETAGCFAGKLILSPPFRPGELSVGIDKAWRSNSRVFSSICSHQTDKTASQNRTQFIIYTQEFQQILWWWWWWWWWWRRRRRRRRWRQWRRRRWRQWWWSVP